MGGESSFSFEYFIHGNYMHVVHFPVRDYDHILLVQQRIRDLLRSGRLTTGYLLLGEHDPVITLGTSTKEGDLIQEARIGERKIPTRVIGRGGRATLHNPGQLVGYFVCNVQELKINADPTLLISRIEDAIIQALTRYGIRASTRDGAPGVWINGKKLGFVGVEWDHQHLMHGFAVNLNNDLSDFSQIAPCGFDAAIITSAEHLLGNPIDLWEFAAQLEPLLGENLGVSLEECSYSDLLLALDLRPPWLTVAQFQLPATLSNRRLLENFRVNTVCESAMCPNRGECYAHHTATFLLLGNCCTRRCAFCAIPKGKALPLDYEEIPRVVHVVENLRLNYVILTSVTRDDLPDGGASYFAATIAAIRRQRPKTQVELLVPDFQGNPTALQTIAESSPTILNHNVETIPRLYDFIRPQADFTRSLAVLEYFRQYTPAIETKSGLMVGLGETWDELVQVFGELARIGVHALTLGQYLRPTKERAKICKYYTPQEFIELQQLAQNAGIPHVFAGPLVRSSYHAAEEHNASGHNVDC